MHYISHPARQTTIHALRNHEHAGKLRVLPHPCIRVRTNRLTGRPLVWTDEQLIAAGLEWQRRHGRLPRASDWSTPKARTKAGDHQRRLDEPPTGALRWPPASTINEAFGSWTRFREHCAHPHHRAPPPQAIAATLLRTADHHEISVHGESAIVDHLHDRWRTAAPPSDHAPELEFVLWALLTGHAALRESDDPLRRTHATDRERVAWQLLNSRVTTRLVFTAAPVAHLGPSDGQLALLDETAGAAPTRTRGLQPNYRKAPR